MQSSPLTKHLLLQNVSVWNPDAVHENYDVEVKDGIITAMKPSKNGHGDDNGISARGLCLMPLGVDPQVHLRVPGQPEKETATTGLKAAVAGAVGAFLTMPNTKPVIDSVDVLNLAKGELSQSDYADDVEVLFSAAITMQQRGKECVNFTELAKAGVAAFTDDGLGVSSDDIMRQAFKASAETGLPILQHAEFPGHGGVLAPSSVQSRLGLNPAYDENAEVAMVERDLKLLADYKGARYHVLHVSSAKTLELVEKARSKGMLVTCEVSPHHLLFTGDDIDSANAAFKMNPPLRAQKDRDALRKGLASGLVDFVATDHAPHEAAVKTSNLRTAAFGTIGLETALRTLLELRREGLIDAKRLVQTFCDIPAKFLGIEKTFGRLDVGRAFRAALIDADAEPRRFTEYEIYSHSQNSCFLGTPLPGRIVRVFTGTNMHTL